MNFKSREKKFAVFLHKVLDLCKNDANLRRIHGRQNHKKKR